MKEYHKIQTLFKRDMDARGKPLIVGDWTNDVFRYLADNEWEFTEKVDGTNVRIMIQDGVVKFGGRADGSSIPATLVNRLQERFLPQTEALVETFPDGACLYGEGYGGKIQAGMSYRPDQDIVLFDVRVGPWWLGRYDVAEVASKFGLDVVPVIGRGTLHDAVRMATAGFDSTWGPFRAEGIVARPTVDLTMRAGERVIAKIKHRDLATR